MKEPIRYSKFEKTLILGVAITWFQFIFIDKLGAIYTMLGLILIVLWGIYEVLRTK